jgi:hypothetical protein
MLLPGYGYAFKNYQDSTQAAITSARQTGAYNALAQQYGPVAGDPDAAIKMQEFGQRQLTNPIDVQQKQASLTGTNLENTGRAETNSYNAQAHPLEIAQKTEANREQPLQFNSEQQQRAASTASMRATAAHTGVETQTAQFALNEPQAAVTARVVNALSDARDKGADPSATFQSLAPALVQQGVMTKEHAVSLATAIRTNPAVIDQLPQMLGGMGVKGMTMVPYSDDPRKTMAVPTSAMPKSQPGIQYTINRQTGAIEGHPVSGTPQALKMAQGELNATKTVEAARMSYTTAETYADAAHQNILHAQQLADAAGMNAYNPLYGSKAKELKNTLQSVGADVVNNIINNFKSSAGPGQASGVGRIMQSEIALWQHAYAAVQESNTPTTLRYNLGQLDRSLSRLRAANQLYNKNVYGFDPPQSGSTGGPLPGGFTNVRKK